MTPNPPKSNSPYEILGLTPSFSITPDQIQRAYLQKLSTAHPDLGIVNSNQSLDPATLNTARDMLLNDESRANLMLDLLAGPPPSNHTLPDGFLMEMMQLRTQIEEELAEEGDEARTRWQGWANQSRVQTIARITDLFNQLNAAQGEHADQLKLEIRVQLNAWRYTQRLIEQLDPTYDPASADF